MDALVKSDLYRATGEVTGKAFFKRLLKDPCFRFLFFFRKVQKTSKISPAGFFYHLLFRRYGIKYGIQIPKTVVIGKGFLMLHEGGIVINAQSIIGDNVTLLHGVTLGNTKRGKLQGTPTIGNNVYIGPGAVIVGKVRVGDHSLIAPNSYVNCDVPDHSIAIGNPCQIISKQNASDGYINNPYEQEI